MKKMQRAYPDGFIEHAKSKIGSEEYRPLDEYNGRFACAIFVSSVLKDFGLIDGRHDKVQVVVHNLSLVKIVVEQKLFKWRKIDIKQIEPGDLIVYAKKKNSGSDHIAIYIGDGEAISNSWKSRTPIKHTVDSPTLGIMKRKRQITYVFALLQEG